MTNLKFKDTGIAKRILHALEIAEDITLDYMSECSGYPGRGAQQELDEIRAAKELIQ